MNNRISLVDTAMLRNFLLAGCNCLGAQKEEVNALNVFPVPDGDTGINMYLTVSSAGKKIAQLPADVGIGKLAADFSMGTLMGARGNSGVILSQIFRGFATSLSGKTTASPRELAAAMKKGVDLSYKSVMKPVEGTILTVYRHFATAAMEAAKQGASVDEMLQQALLAGKKALECTPDLLPVLKEAGVVDAGGKGLLVFMYGATNALLEGGDIILEDYSATSEPAEQKVNDATASRNDISTAKIEFGFCTQMLIKGSGIPIDRIRERLSHNPPGDSLLVVGDENIVKIHFHNNLPWKVLEYCSQFGELHDIIIDNMHDQHHENMALADAQNKTEVIKTTDEPELPNLPANAVCGVIAVCAGDGVAQIYSDLGALVISGGQTMNPSAEDLLQAIEHCPTQQIVLLPNNGNIIMAAQQAQKLTHKQVTIVPTKFVTAGLSAMLSFVSTESAEVNAKTMQRAAAEVINGELTYAVRDTKFNGFDIKQGDLLALNQGKIAGCGSDLKQVLNELVDKMLADKEEAEIITLYYGNDLNKDQAQELADSLSSRCDEYEVELYYGGQPLYYFLLAIE